MGEPFPPHRHLSGNFAPLLMECDAPDLPVLGGMPHELGGTLYRIGSNPQYPPRDEHYHWYVGDGMIHAFRFQYGRVAYRNRWVRTRKFLAERAAGRALYGSWDNPTTSDPSVAGRESGGPANGNVVWHGGRLLALSSNHLPVEVDWQRLDTVGSWDFGRNPIRRMSSHPKLDPVTQELLFFAYGADGPLTQRILYGVADSEGELRRLDTFDAPFAGLMHDLIMTRDHVLFPLVPLVGCPKRRSRGEPAYAWEPGRGVAIGVLRRDRPVAEMRWFKGDACSFFHVMSAWEEGDKIVAHLMQFEGAPPFPRIDRRERATPQPRLSRWTFDLAGESDHVTREYIDDLAGEVPRIDERFLGGRHRHGWYAVLGRDAGGRSALNALAHLDLVTGQRALYRLPESDRVSEPVFVPRAADAAEGDGWLLALAYRGVERRSDILVFAATDLAAGPLATAQLPHRIPYDFHGSWRPAAA
jgi:carotenoid cleavage dioxygenase-like enzyme